MENSTTMQSVIQNLMDRRGTQCVVKGSIGLRVGDDIRWQQSKDHRLHLIRDRDDNIVTISVMSDPDSPEMTPDENAGNLLEEGNYLFQIEKILR